MKETLTRVYHYLFVYFLFIKLTETSVKARISSDEVKSKIRKHRERERDSQQGTCKQNHLFHQMSVRENVPHKLVFLCRGRDEGLQIRWNNVKKMILPLLVCIRVSIPPSLPPCSLRVLSSPPYTSPRLPILPSTRFYVFELFSSPFTVSSQPASPNLTFRNPSSPNAFSIPLPLFSRLRPRPFVSPYLHAFSLLSLIF